MDTPDGHLPTRIVVSRAMLSMPVFLLVFISFEAALVFSIFAVISGEWLWWAGTFTAVSFAALLRWKQVHGLQHWNSVNSLEIRDGTITFVPSRRMCQMGYARSEASFADDAGLECHLETGDRYFTGDHGQFLKKSLWIVAPNGTRQVFIDDAVALSLERMAINLPNSGIGFRVIRVYDGQEGEHSETDVTADYTQTRSIPQRLSPLFAVLIGTSGLWLGALAGALVHKVGYAVAIGFVGYGLIAVLALCSKTSKRSALVQVASIIPSYAGGYAFMLISVWYLFRR